MSARVRPETREPRSIPAFEALSDIDASNVVRCARVLLRRPLLHPGSPDGDLLPMIYRQRVALQELFATLLGYRLVVQRRFARLYKSGPGVDDTRGESTLSPRAYAYLALTLAALTGIGRQVLLSRLVSDVRAVAAEAELVTTDDPADRRALTAALRHLVGLGVISETEGAVSPLANDAAAEALITIDTDLLGHLLSGPLAEAESPEDLITRAAQAGPKGLEHLVRRRLVEDPVVLHADLPPDQEQWLRQNHAAESRVLERYFGLISEARAEGIAVTDPEDFLTDVGFPGPGTVARIALLALPELLERSAPETDGQHPVDSTDLAEVCEQLVHDYPAAWAKQAADEPEELVTSVIDLLRRLGLLRARDADAPDDGRWLLSPAAHRWVPQPDATPTTHREPEPAPIPPAPSLSLFDDVEDEGGR